MTQKDVENKLRLSMYLKKVTTEFKPRKIFAFL
jgi:hypothetical protein